MTEKGSQVPTFKKNIKIKFMIFLLDLNHDLNQQFKSTWFKSHQPCLMVNNNGLIIKWLNDFFIKWLNGIFCSMLIGNTKLYFGRTSFSRAFVVKSPRHQDVLTPLPRLRYLLMNGWIINTSFILSLYWEQLYNLLHICITYCS